MMRIVEMKYQAKGNFMRPSEGIWLATVEHEGYLYDFSQFNSEDKWYLDAKWSDKGLPVFAHGEGSRCCAKRVADSDLKEALDEYRNQEHGPVMAD